MKNVFFASLLLATVAAVGCSVIVNGKLQNRVASCSGQPDSTPCLGADYCVGGACVFASCGDGVVTAGETCDDGNQVSSDGCTTVCAYTCSQSAQCDDGSVCNGTETCNAQHACLPGTPANPGVTCDPGDGSSGTCNGSGLCVSAGCGNGTVEPSEDCEPPGSTGCREDCRWVCSSDFDCPTDDPCTQNLSCNQVTHTCDAAAPPTCDDGDPCSDDTCESPTGCAFTIIDRDGDGYAPAPAPLGTCVANPAYFGGDCDDRSPESHPGAVDLCFDQIDQDCSGTADDGGPLTCYPDNDGDGFGDPSAGISASCSCPQGYVASTMGSDCDDTTSEIRPNYPGEQIRWRSMPACPYGQQPSDKGGGTWSCPDDSTPIWDVDCDGAVVLQLTDTSSVCRADAGGGGQCSGSGFAGSLPDCGQEANYVVCERSCTLFTVCSCKTYEGPVTQLCH